MFLLLINTSKKWGGGELWFGETAKALTERNFHIIVIVTKNSPLEKYVKAAGIMVLSAKRSPLWQILYLFRIKNDPLRHTPDCIIVNSGIDLMHALIIKQTMDKSIIIFRRGLDKPLKNSLFNRLIYKQVDIFVANSQATARTLQQSFPWLNREKIQIIYNPISINALPDIPTDQLKQKYYIKKEIPILGIIGRLSRQKGHTILLDALKKILLYFPETILLIIGDGELKAELAAYVKKNRIEKNCLFLGHQHDIVSHYLLCDLVIIPSLFEGFCFSAIEAQFLAIPVIASNISSLPEVIKDGKTGLLFKTGDHEDLADKIIYLLKNSILRKQMGHTAKKYVTKKFDQFTIYRQIEHLLRNL
jgi:glycosyltransferase involved in cell wall biosynthesis